MELAKQQERFLNVIGERYGDEKKQLARGFAERSCHHFKQDPEATMAVLELMAYPRRDREQVTSKWGITSKYLANLLYRLGQNKQFGKLRFLLPYGTDVPEEKVSMKVLLLSKEIALLRL